MLPALVLAIHAASIISDETSLGSDFNDLGKLMLLGFIGAVVVALALTFVRFRLRDKKPQAPYFTSIIVSAEDETTEQA